MRYNVFVLFQTRNLCCFRGYQLLNDATDLGHVDAEVEIGFAHLMGAFLPLQISKARKIFEKHAASGNPRAQAV